MDKTVLGRARLLALAYDSNSSPQKAIQLFYRKSSFITGAQLQNHCTFALMKGEADKKLKQRNIKPTAMRQLVFEVLNQQKKALSLYEIEQHFDDVDRSTLFRTLKTFQENFLIHSIDDGTGAVKYALCDDDCTCNIDDLHIHFLCNKCGQTHCMKDMPVPKMDLPEDFSFQSANFVIKGTCPNCQE